MTITTGKTYEKVFEGYAPKSGLWWDKCTECNQTLDIPAKDRWMQRNSLNIWKLQIGTVLKHGSKRGQELHDTIIHRRGVIRTR